MRRYERSHYKLQVVPNSEYMSITDCVVHLQKKYSIAKSSPPSPRLPYRTTLVFAYKKSMLLQNQVHQVLIFHIVRLWCSSQAHGRAIKLERNFHGRIQRLAHTILIRQQLKSFLHANGKDILRDSLAVLMSKCKLNGFSQIRRDCRGGWRPSLEIPQPRQNDHSVHY